MAYVLFGHRGRLNARSRLRAPSGPPDIDTTPPDAPTLLAATAGTGQITLDWTASASGDAAYVRVYRADTPGGPYVQINTNGQTTGTTYVDSSATANVPWYYVVTAVDAHANESAASNEASATITQVGPDAATLRRRMLAARVPFRVVRPAPDGTIDTADRAMLAGQYRRD